MELENRKYQGTRTEPLEIVIEEMEGSEDKYENVRVVIEEVSFEGVRFTADVEFRKDEEIHFRLPSINVESLVAGRIVWKKELETKQYQYGLHILSE
ncbi:hypothetical protein BG53_15645 [Paenibacillus darwinianus]|uniref:PilZ domain-containing protein n=1 Tax=Paenibacillus darwinianus TaxID=1380763 RepID=A0A9W5S2E5_9BACL|nr:PilZ domain-containing protein [Paenibacillus darwinianus]EXX89498.1 hypothetical protein BG53_15645 [Paenibacillus darwinianus]EXX91200.1 hypothetical protein CH50_14000 [Paenibacillus darwinianus]EXX92535.1 hypothetical protein BG52_10805 [Paenibacillus darwinianus]